MKGSPVGWWWGANTSLQANQVKNHLSGGKAHYDSFTLNRKIIQMNYLEWSPPWHFKTATLDFMSAWSGQVRVDIQLISWNAFWNSQLRRLTSNLLTFFLTYLLTLFLTYLLAFFLTYLLTFFLTYLLTYLVTFFLTHLLKFFLTYLLAFFLTYCWTFFWYSFWHIFWHSFWHIFWHSFWHIFGHSFWHFFWHSFWHIFCHSVWHIFWHSLTCYVTHRLTFFLTFVLWHSCWQSLLATAYQRQNIASTASHKSHSTNSIFTAHHAAKVISMTTLRLSNPHCIGQPRQEAVESKDAKRL